jgi:hypothetical protein
MSLDPNKIDSAEIIIATLGMRPIISREIEKPTQAQMMSIADFPARIIRLAKKLVAGSLPEIDDMPAVQYDKMLNDLTMPFEPEQAMETIGKFPGDEQVKLDAMDIAKKAFDLLRDVLPMSVYQTTNNTVNLAISDPQWWQWQEALELLDKPLNVFNLIETGEILPSQVAAMREIYPTICGAIDSAIQDATTEAMSRVQSFELPEHCEFGVANWFDTPIDVAPYQAAYTTLDHAKDVQPSGNKPPESAASLTSAERTALEPVTGKAA